MNNLDDLDYHDLTPSQQERVYQGCLYELAKLISTVLLALIFLFALPFTGPAGKWITMILMVMGAFLVARMIIHKWVYPERPFVQLYLELKTKRNEEK